MKWKTAIAGHKDGEINVRGEKLLNLIGQMSFTEAVFFVLRGEKPTEAETNLLDIVLVSAINHGLEAPSAYVPRVIASTGNSVNTALASGVLAIGDHHGGAVDNLMKILQLAALDNRSAEKIVKEVIEKGERMPGFGHKLYKDLDPRVAVILKKLEDLNVESKYAKLALDIQSELQRQVGKVLPLNIDGIMAVVLCELGFDWRLGKAFFAFARIPTMMANIEEELKNEKPYRRLEEGDIEYSGS